MKTKTYVAILTLPVDADVKRRKIYEKTGTVTDYFLKLMTIRFFKKNFFSNH
jgi:hypothetical protein